MKGNSKSLKIGQIYLMEFSGGYNEQYGVRPGLVVQNNIGNAYSPNIIAVPLTSAIKKTDLPTHLIIEASPSGLKKDSVVLCENPERISKRRVGDFITELDSEQMKKVAKAYTLSSSIIAYLSIEELADVWGNSKRLNGMAM
ncbi:MAG: type II toxin-antitoxin system PemK/MazF family toxin [Bacteroides sp.]